MIDASIFIEDAIQKALQQDWPAAIKINTEIIAKDKTNVDAWSRLGFAFLQNGQLKKAKETFEKVLKLDAYNQIAQKNLKKLCSVKKSSLKQAKPREMSPTLFLEEPGKTKVVDCINVAPLAMLSCLSCGQEITLKPKRHGIEVRDTHDHYIGALPDDIAFRLCKLITAGNEYKMYVKGIGKNCLSVFIREVKRASKLEHQPSFSGSMNYIPYQKDAHDEEKKQETETDEEAQEE